MARLIDAKALEKQIKEIFEESNPYIMGILLRWIRKQNTVDAVPVVRCKDCKHYKPMKPYPSYNGSVNYCCRSSFIKVGNNDFCSYGERKDNERKAD